MKFLLFTYVLIGFLCTSFYAAADEPDKPISYHRNLVEGVIFPASKKTFSYNATSTWTPSVSNIDKVENLLLPALKKYAVKNLRKKGYDYNAESAAQIILKLSSYKRQYAGIVRGNKKIIVINFFCRSYNKWQEEVVAIDDGGNCYFMMEYDIDKNEFVSFQVNGIG